MSLSYQIFFLIITYLWGSIPAGYLIVRYHLGKNILTLGSGNVGSTNVKRIAGKKWSVITQLADMLKGLLPVGLFLMFHPQDTMPYYVFMLALAAILGHDFSIYLRFKGGKGVNTTLGASVLLAPISVFVAVALYFVVKWRFKYVSLGSLVLALALPLSEFIVHQFSTTFYYLLVCSCLIILLHRQNIIRLIKGKELPDSKIEISG